MKKQLLYIFLFLGVFSSQAQNKNITGSEYADVVLDAYYSGANRNFKVLYGGYGNRFPMPVPPTVVLGNTEGFLSLPKNSYVIIGFTDNTVIDAPDQKDLFIEELGGSGEFADVFVSADGKNFTFLGKAQDNGLTSFDLADINFKEPVVAVKIVGLDNKGASPGFDVKSVKALLGSIGQASTKVNLTAMNPDKKEEPKKEVVKVKKEAELDTTSEFDKLLRRQTVTLKTPKTPKKTFTFKNVYFGYNKYMITRKARNELNKLVKTLKENPEIKINLAGHTDNWGNDAKNQVLSENRVKAVVNYISEKGIQKDRIKMATFGEKKPITDNRTAKGRALNRRVEITLAD